MSLAYIRLQIYSKFKKYQNIYNNDLLSVVGMHDMSNTKKLLKHNILLLYFYNILK